MKKLGLFVIALILVLSACKKKQEESTPEFNKGELLTNLADNIIVPAINAFDQSITELQNSFSVFQTTPDQTNLDVLRNEWKESYLLWQAVKPFDFGPMRDNGLKPSVCTYPTDTAVVLSNIASGSYNLSTAGNVDASGLSALDYLLYKHDALNAFQTDANYMTYASDVINKLKAESALLKNQWSSYRSTFVASTGTESTSAFSLLVNEFNRDYELAKNAKLGIPIGKQSLGIQLPEYVEARYSGISFELLDESIRRLQLLYNGNSFAGSTAGTGFDDYLTHLEKSSLSSAINTRFSEIRTFISGISGTLEENMSSNPLQLDQLYNLIAGQVVNIKTDMTSAFGVLITYQDNDGD